MPDTPQLHPASYRDPSGFVFEHQGTLYRQVNLVFRDDFEKFTRSGLAAHLVQEGLLVPHEELSENLAGRPDWLTTLKPERIGFISYPFEWSFDMLKDAALLTLRLAKEAMKFGLMLKDATPYNVQLHRGKMVFIDTLSFERYDETRPWVAYRQFCESFLAPLALMHYLQTPLQPLLLAYPEGLPLPLVRKMLPFKSRFHLHVSLHLRLQAAYVSAAAPKETKTTAAFSARKLEHILTSLEQAVQSFALQQPSGVWSGYYEEALQRGNYVTHKKKVIEEWLEHLPGLATAIDVGANEGTFSELAAARRIHTVAADGDHFSVNNLYRKIKKEGNAFLHPLVIDFVHPSPAIGVNNRERASLLERSPFDLVLALAVIHHLAIGKHLSFEQIAELFGRLGNTVIVEFVPPQDEKTQQLLQQKTIAFPWYTQEQFEAVFARYFNLVKTAPLPGTTRVLYLLKKK
ncbi:hypothetical protein V9K67_14065 [Paraflavisolibacter sp. H34]|uniref:hypothetical protein n=1 Tax=Huijunlia imazamoxiresistens TaxID=3127457 RepID=UPI003019B5E8